MIPLDQRHHHSHSHLHRSHPQQRPPTLTISISGKLRPPVGGRAADSSFHSCSVSSSVTSSRSPSIRTDSRSATDSGPSGRAAPAPPPPPADPAGGGGGGGGGGGESPRRGESTALRGLRTGGGGVCLNAANGMSALYIKCGVRAVMGLCIGSHRLHRMLS